MTLPTEFYRNEIMMHDSTTDQTSTIFNEDGYLMISDLHDLKKRFKREKQKLASTTTQNVVEPAPILLNMNELPPPKIHHRKHRRKIRKNAKDANKSPKSPKLHKKHHVKPRRRSQSQLNDSELQKISIKNSSLTPKQNHKSVFPRTKSDIKLIQDLISNPKQKRKCAETALNLQFNKSNSDTRFVSSKHNSHKSKQNNLIDRSVPIIDEKNFNNEVDNKNIISDSTKSALDLLTHGLTPSASPITPLAVEKPIPLVTCADDVTFDQIKQNDFLQKRLKHYRKKHNKQTSSLICPVPNWLSFQVDLISLPNDSAIEQAATKKYHIPDLIKQIKEQ